MFGLASAMGLLLHVVIFVVFLPNWRLFLPIGGLRMRRRHSDHVCYALKDFTEIANNQFSCMQFHPHRLLLYPRRRARGNEFIHSSVGCGFKWRQLTAACRIHVGLRQRQGCLLPGATFIVQLCCCYYDCFVVVVLSCRAYSRSVIAHTRFLSFSITLSISHVVNVFVGRIINEACPHKYSYFNWIGSNYFCTGFTA